MENIVLSNAIALVALLMSGYAIYQSHGVNKRLKPLNESQEKINKIFLEKDKHDSEVTRKAEINAEYAEETSKLCLKIWNSGLATARNVQISPQVGVKHPLDESVLKKTFPLESLAAGKVVNVVALPSSDRTRQHTIRFTWDDEFESGREIVVHLTP